MTKTISIVTLKGGVGKSSTCLATAGIFSSENKKVLLIDLDYQCNVTKTWVFDPNKPTIWDNLVDGAKFDPLVINKNLHLIQGDLKMKDFPLKMQGRSYAPFALKDFLGQVKGYDIIIVDVPAKLDLEARNAIQASDLLFSVIQPEQYSIENIYTFIDELKIERAQLDGIFVNMIDGRLKAHKAVISQLKKTFGDLVMDAQIPMDTKVKEAAISSELLNDYAPKSKANLAFKQLIREICQK